jgi:hypothetical protein
MGASGGYRWGHARWRHAQQDEASEHGTTILTTATSKTLPQRGQRQPLC